MPRQKYIGKVEPIQKVYLSKPELASYLGVSERYIEENINKNPDVEIYKLSKRCFLYRIDNINKVVRNSYIDRL